MYKDISSAILPECHAQRSVYGRTELLLYNAMPQFKLPKLCVTMFREANKLYCYTNTCLVRYIGPVNIICWPHIHSSTHPPIQHICNRFNIMTVVFRVWRPFDRSQSLASCTPSSPVQSHPNPIHYMPVCVYARDRNNS